MPFGITNTWADACKFVREEVALYLELLNPDALLLSGKNGGFLLGALCSEGINTPSVVIGNSKEMGHFKSEEEILQFLSNENLLKEETKELSEILEVVGAEKARILIIEDVVTTRPTGTYAMLRACILAHGAIPLGVVACGDPEFDNGLVGFMDDSLWLLRSEGDRRYIEEDDEEKPAFRKWLSENLITDPYLWTLID